MTGTTAGTREFAAICLEHGHKLTYKSWTFWSTGWCCGGGCCSDEGLTIEEALDCLGTFCDGRFEDVIVEGLR